jgi:ABC-type phosphate/phosphonate transport system permease subunit
MKLKTEEFTTKSLGFAKHYLTLSFLTNKELIYYGNDFILNNYGKVFNIDIDLLYSDSFNSYAIAVMALIIAVSIPLLINLYTNANQGDTLTKLFIKENFNSDDILFFLIFSTGFLISRNSILVALGFVYVTILFYKKSELYFSFLYKTHETLFNFIKEVSENSKSRDLKYALAPN